MGINKETGFAYTRSHHEDSDYTAGYFEYIRHQIAPAHLSIRTHLSFTQASNEGPFAACIGLVDVVYTDPDQADIHADPNDPSTWAPLAYGEISSYRVGLHVTWGVMTGSVVSLFWD